MVSFNLPSSSSIRRWALIAIGAACSRASTARRSDLSMIHSNPNFQTDSSAYTLQSGVVWYQAAISATFVNRTGAKVYFVNCQGSTGVVLQKLVGDRWIDAWSPNLTTCLSPPIVVLPGHEQRWPIHVVAGYPGTNVVPKFTTPDIAGTYRAVWTQALTSYDARSSTFGTVLPLDHRLSNTFAIALHARR
jgi:hypothetical protein